MQINFKTKETNAEQNIESNLKDEIKVSKSQSPKNHKPQMVSQGNYITLQKSDNPNLT